MEFGEKTLSKKEVFKGHLISVETHRVQLIDGREADREIILHGPAVGILATQEDKILLERQYRKGIEKAIVEIPAGLVEQDEDWLLAAQRELEEETHFKAEEWVKLDGFYSSPGFLDEYLQLYRARDLSLVENPRPADSDEHIEVLWMTLPEAKQAIKEGEIADAKTLYAVKEWELEKLTHESRRTD